MTTAGRPVADEIEALAAAIREHPLDWQDHWAADEQVAHALRSLEGAVDRAALAQRTELLRSEFEELAGRWHEETSGYSFAAQYAAHPAYRRIIGMGYAVLPLIFERLAETGGRWYVALHAITNASPVSDEDRGRQEQVRAAWLAWGREQQIISAPAALTG